jgi:hypothetical protein
LTRDSILVRIASDWNSSGLLRQTHGGHGIWDGVRFTTGPVEGCDLLVVLNNRHLDDIEVRCAPGNVWAIMQEPYEPGLFDWLIEGHESYARVFTHLIPSQDPKYFRSQPAMPWEAGLDFDELMAARRLVKTKNVSWIASSLTFLPGHRRRARLREHLLRHAPDLVHLFGRGIQWIPRKWEALAPYRFSLCIENSVGADLRTEKVADCFLSWTVPLYMGCTNLEDYFPAESFIRVDADDPPPFARRLVGAHRPSAIWHPRASGRALCHERRQRFAREVLVHGNPGRLGGSHVRIVSAYSPFNASTTHAPTAFAPPGGWSD